MEAKAEKNEKAKKEYELRKLEAEKKKESRAAEKVQKEAEKAQREVDAAAREAFKQKWSPDAIKQAGEHLQWLLKNAGPPLPGAYRAPFCGVLPQICKENMARRLAKRRAAKYGIGRGDLVPASTPPAWVHQCNPYFMVDGEGGLTENAPSACRHRAASSLVPPRTAHAVAPTTVQGLARPMIPGLRLARPNTTPANNIVAAASSIAAGASAGPFLTRTVGLPTPVLCGGSASLFTVQTACAPTSHAESLVQFGDAPPEELLHGPGQVQQSSDAM